MSKLSRMHRGPARLTALAACLVAALITLACARSTTDATASGLSGSDGCFADPNLETVTRTGADMAGTTITLDTHDSFVVSPATLEVFTAQTGIKVIQVGRGDAGQLVSSAVLTRDNPTADVMFGIDNAFLCRGLNNDIFMPYTAENLNSIPEALRVDPHNRVTPIDFGDVCLNYWIDSAPIAPTGLDSLLDTRLRGQFVTEDPETSSPGLAFLLATIATYGEDGWEDYWTELGANDVAVTSGWNDAYYGEFVAGGGSRSVVTSYASSPAAEVIFADPPITSPPTGVVVDSCFRQIEFAGILAGSEHPEAAAALIDFMLSPTFQEDIPLNMFVYPAVSGTALPAAFVEHTPAIDNPLTIDPAAIEAGRDDWTARWREIVLR